MNEAEEQWMTLDINLRPPRAHAHTCTCISPAWMPTHMQKHAHTQDKNVMSILGGSMEPTVMPLIQVTVSLFCEGQSCWLEMHTEPGTVVAPL